MPLLRAGLLRLVTTAVSLLGVAVIVFVVIRVVPGNPIAMMLPPGATAFDVARLTAQYRMDVGIAEQFLIWAGGVLRGDFGVWITARQPVLILVLLFGVLWPLFHISGRVIPSLDLPFSINFYLIEGVLRLWFDLWVDIVSHVYLPALALVIPLAAITGQLLKHSLKETMNLDYLTLARTAG